MSQAAAYFAAGLADSTKATYRSAHASWLRFCHELNINASLPISTELACLWITFLTRTMKPPSITVYIEALHSIHLDNQLPSPFRNALVRRTFRGVKRTVGTPQRALKLPITPSVVDKVLAAADLNTWSHLVVATAAAVATAGLLRISDFAPAPGTHALLRSNIRRATDASSRARYYILHLPRSKTDTFRKGADVVIASTTAVKLLDRMLAGHPSATPTSPLFCLAAGRPQTAMSRAPFLQLFSTLLSRARVPRAGFRGVSFRRGGATQLALQGVPDSAIKDMGRWTSECFTRYIHYDIANKLKLAQLL